MHYRRCLELHPDHNKIKYLRTLELHPDYSKTNYIKRRDKILKQKKEYSSRPEVKKHRIEYMKLWHLRKKIFNCYK